MNYTKEQTEAINYLKGNLRIIACAGSGKTQVISARIAKLVQSGTDPKNILAFAFTDKSAAELKYRVRKEVEKLPEKIDCNDFSISTIHSFSFNYLQKIKPQLKDYEILDENRKILFIDRYYYFLGLKQLREESEKHFDTVLRFIKTMDIATHNLIDSAWFEKHSKVFYEAYCKYLQLLEKHKYFDFSEVIKKLYNIFLNDPKELNAVREQYKYITVDEYQDINPIQEKLINLIARDNGNLCVVGDDDQAIFEFQGAAITNILDFEQRYKNVKTITLSKNFRSTKAIVDSAASLIERNKKRVKKDISCGTNSDILGGIEKRVFNNTSEQAKFIGEKILELRGCENIDSNGTKRGLDWSDFTVIVRNNSSSKSFIKAFNDLGIPFTARGTAGLFQRNEIYFFQLIFNYFCDSKIYIDQFDQITCDEKRIRDFYLRFLNNQKIEAIVKVIKKNKQIILSGKRFYPQDIFQDILNAMGATEGLFNEGQLFDFARFSKIILEFERVHEFIDLRRFKDFVRFINSYASYKAEIGSMEDPTKINTVLIQTIHKAKGTEYPVVFVPDLDENILPSKYCAKRPNVYLGNYDLTSYVSGEEGERRLFYVAVTRPKRFLFLTSANARQKSKFFNEYNASFPETNLTSEIKKIDPKPKDSAEMITTNITNIKYYIECPYNYLLKVVMGFTPTIEESFGYGFQVHDILDSIFSLGNQPTAKEIDKLVEDMYFLRYSSGNILNKTKNKAKQIIKKYISKHQSDFNHVLEAEKNFDFVIGNALISGKIDLLLKKDTTDDEISLKDFKTENEKSAKKRQYLSELQLQLYAIAAKESLNLQPRNAEIYYLTDNRKVNVDISEGKLAEAKKKINFAIKGMTAGSYPQKCENCKNCDNNRICCRK